MTNNYGKQNHNENIHPDRVGIPQFSSAIVLTSRDEAGTATPTLRRCVIPTEVEGSIKNILRNLLRWFSQLKTKN